jgi:mono/diheme cytochrome c family protein
MLAVISCWKDFTWQFVIALALSSVQLAANSVSAADIEYNRDVRPILSDNCFQCHGSDPQSRAAELRLDLSEAAARGGESGAPAIVPGDPDASQLIQRIIVHDDAERMPPADTKPRLTEKQIETLRKWIAAGAKYQAHWALIPPQATKVPEAASDDTKGKPWAINEIDRFVLSRLQRERLSPSAEASRAALLRRVYLDLIGLPPSNEDVEKYLKDETPGSYERQIDRLLASEDFGEKWARHWLDLARYEKDLPRRQFPWREWVIDAINRDMPYDQFVIEQVAGDLLPAATQDQRIATGFMGNGMINQEGAIVNEQYRMEGLFDRLDCLGKSVLGLTVQCAQCHSHKFDPISHEEYYRLLAFLNDDYEAVVAVYTQEQLKTIAAIEQEDRRLESQLKQQHSDWQQRFAAWQADAKPLEDAWSILLPIEPEGFGGLAHPEVLPDRSVMTLGFRPEGGELTFTTTTTLPSVAALRFDALTHGDLPFNGPGRSPRGTCPVSEIVVEAHPLDDPKTKWKKVPFADATANFAQAEKRSDGDKRAIGPAKFLIDGKDETAWGADRGPGRRNQDLAAHLQFAKPLAYPNGVRFKVTLKFAHGAILGRFRLSATGNDKPLQPLPRFVTEALSTSTDQRSEQQSQQLFTFWRAQEAAFAATNEKIDQLWSGYPEIGETVLSIVARLPEHHRTTAILDRGDWQKPTTAVTPGVPAAFHPLPADAAPNRLAFARWLVDRRSPTAARVAVNRVWHTVFGIGIVETSEDFGTRASTPSHPELLDWLAVDFVEHHWTLKHLLRTIVTSATYRQSSQFTDQLLERDPKNRLLARGPRFRVDAEVARDTVLTAAGLLHRQRGGPSFFPPVPESLFATSYMPVDFWQTAAAPERYRRSLYMFRRRSIPDPVLASFDAPNGEFSCPRRSRSNTPLAALTALNEPVFVDAARALALRVLREAGASDRERAEYAFKLCTNRTPTAAEVDEMLTLYRSQRQRVADGWLSPRALTTGDHQKLPELPAGVNPTDAAAWTVVARVLLNLDETLTKS